MLLIDNIGQLVTFQADSDNLGVILDASILIDQDKIVWRGPKQQPQFELSRTKVKSSGHQMRVKMALVIGGGQRSAKRPERHTFDISFDIGLVKI